MLVPGGADVFLVQTQDEQTFAAVLPEDAPPGAGIGAASSANHRYALTIRDGVADITRTVDDLTVQNTFAVGPGPHRLTIDATATAYTLRVDDRTLVAGAHGCCPRRWRKTSSAAASCSSAAITAARSPSYRSLDWKMMKNLDDSIRHGWDNDVVRSDDPRRQSVESIDLPFPWVAGAAPTSPDWYTTMFSWDTYFTNLALIVHDRLDLIRGNIENYLFLIERFGYMPNGNEQPLSTRSQIPLFADSILRYIRATGDQELLHRAYPLLVREYRDYWLADHHATPTGLVTNRDLGDPTLDPRLAAEAETGLDWTTQFDGDVTHTNPVMTNAALVVYARTLAHLANMLKLPDQVREFTADADRRATLMRRFCWSEDRGHYLDYDYVREQHVAVLGATSYWALWAGVATGEQTARMAAGLDDLLRDHGLLSTEQSRPDPARFALEYEDLQWTYPAGWPPLHIIACWGLDRYGYTDHADKIATRLLATITRHLGETGETYEKYNVVDGSLDLPNSRYGTITLHGWTTAALVLLPRRPLDGLLP
ncbi:alpha,alpha-trehalase [Frondihabitans sp. PAMC 28766]|uniref:alpha,alpha-trehalase n=1 Tax=Frondihabitans sp. PAMC 28766 TaxID=1795630 RepID=UPI001EF64F14|nr:alpha,alpha-trehalase [Frondihabitans sp. PAMC 28766]